MLESRSKCTHPQGQLGFVSGLWTLCYDRQTIHNFYLAICTAQHCRILSIYAIVVAIQSDIALCLNHVLQCYVISTLLYKYPARELSLVSEASIYSISLVGGESARLWGM